MKITLPEKFEHRMREQLGEEYEDYLKCFGERCRAGLRVNTLKLSPEEFERLSPFPLERIPWIENGFFYPDEEQPAKHPYYFGGLYYLQEPSAMTPASLLPVKPGDRVLDVCAAPGGKSTELAARLGGEGVLVSNDISNSRAKALLKNLELFGVKNAIVVSEAPSKLAGRFAGYFDKILVDAPCSGEGMFRKSPAIMKNWEQYGTGYYNELQKQILPEAIRMLRPGGYLLYSTCTFSPEENEGTVQYVLDNFSEMELVPTLPAQVDQKSGSGQDMEERLHASGAYAPWKPDYTGMEHGRPEWTEHGSPLLALTLRLWPHKIRGEGHFIALLRKKGEDPADGAGQKAPEAAFWQITGQEAEDSRLFGQENGKKAKNSSPITRKTGTETQDR
ncbi:MAG: RsmB/NOP family class I SAM-dependent RNA methyltransferase, partial [Lachnospiraceae bacterium]|nr:RsmB/NOP family class I SAM-dependent RNA methyltransferase [Lachnospiraceae bacterium]